MLEGVAKKPSILLKERRSGGYGVLFDAGIIFSMLRLHTDDLDAGQLQNRLELLLDQGFERLPENRYLTTVLPLSPLRRLLRRSGVLRQIHSKLIAWKLAGWSVRWLVRQTPLVGPFAWHLWGKLTLRGFRQHVLAELDKLSVANQQLQARLVLIESTLEQHQERGARQDERISAEACNNNEIQVKLAADIRHLEQLAMTSKQANSDLFPEWYLALENQYRGKVEDIEARLCCYLPYLACAQVGQIGWPVLDLGCGRGEWLMLLGRHQIVALGVDNNAAMLGEARQQGLDVIESDLLTYLRATDSNSIGAVTAFQVVEHLNQNILLELFQEASRVLRPGGVLLLETPNPENLQVAAYSFWLDPTHVRPIPPPLLAHSAAYFGFIDISIERSNAWSEALQLQDTSEAARHLEKLMFSAQDYALIARKPYAQEAQPTLA